MSETGEAAGVARESISRMLAGAGNPTPSDPRGIPRAIGLKMANLPYRRYSKANATSA